MSLSTWTVLAESSSQTFFRFARLPSMSEWWHWLLLATISCAVVAYVTVMYRFDGVDLKRGTKWSLVSLRLLALVGILFFFFDLEKRTEHRERKHSRAVVLVDTSQSMGLQDTGSSGRSSEISRIDQVTMELQDGDLLEKLRSSHDVAVYRFDQQSEPHEVAFFQRSAPPTSDPQPQIQRAEQRRAAQQRAHTLSLVAAGLFGISLLAFLGFIFTLWYSRQEELAAWLLFTTVIMLFASLTGLAVAHLGASDLSWKQIAGLAPVTTGPETADSQSDQATVPETEPAEDEPELAPLAWHETLEPRGTETRIGDALQKLVSMERGGPIAGVVLISDGQNNAGIDCLTATAAAESAEIPVFTVGLGSDQQPANVRIVDLEAPKRVFPGDKFIVTGYVQAYGLQDQLVSLELAVTDAGNQDRQDLPADLPLEDEQTVRLAADGEVLPVQFEVSPNETGTYLYRLRLDAPKQDLETRDNQKTARVKVVDRKNRVLLLAGGPTREFRFLRNQLYRDQDTTVDVWLQSSTVGISQEADQVLNEFPVLTDELFQYDCILAFDPDWLALDLEQMRSLDRWVAEQAGGLITIAGPIHTPNWTALRRGRDPRADAIRTLYPVIFYSQGSANLSLGRFGGESAWPLNFTRDGANAEFLRLEDDPLQSEAAWNSFDGVYGYYSVKDPKPGARVFARFSNPETSMDGELPIYAAGHLYGAGRVFFQASGEMWRLRAVDVKYFETYYTKLIRWASQGRLLRDSSRGILLVDKDRCLLGDRVTARAVLNDAQHKPLLLEQVPAIILTPNGQRQPITLRKVQNAAREGIFEAQFPALRQGDYRVELTPPDSTDNELLTAEVRVRVPALEIENPQRNDVLLKEIAQRTGAEYFVGLAAAMNRRGTSGGSLPALIQPNDQLIFLPPSMDTRFDQRLMGWLIILISSLLSMEWFIRRMHKLA